MIRYFKMILFTWLLGASIEPTNWRYFSSIVFSHESVGPLADPPTSDWDPIGLDEKTPIFDD